MSRSPHLVLKSDPSKVAPLDPGTPLTIGRSARNRLSLPRESRVSEHHAVVRHSTDKGWLICDWKSDAGTFLNGEPVQFCRPLTDGAAIELGPDGPVLIFRTGQDQAPAAVPAVATGPIQPPLPAAAPGSPPAPSPSRSSRRPGETPPNRPPGDSAPRTPGTPRSLDFAGQSLPLDQILSATVRSEPRHPHIFSWWLLLSLGSLLLLPFPWLFWILEITGLAGWIVLGSRKEHSLVVVLRNGLAYRRTFANRPTALSHRNGIRRALGQSPEHG